MLQVRRISADTLQVVDREQYAGFYVDDHSEIESLDAFAGVARELTSFMARMEAISRLFYMDALLTALLCCSALVGLISTPREIWLWLPSTGLLLSSIITFSGLLALDDGCR